MPPSLENAPSAPPATPATTYWIPLDLAVRHFAVERSALVAAVRRGELEARRIVVGEDLAVALSSRELDERFARRATPLAAATSPPAPEDERLRELERALADERTARARAEGELASSDRVERSLQRYADRLEGELERTRKQMLSLARALGRAEQLAASAGLRLPDPGE